MRNWPLSCVCVCTRGWLSFSDVGFFLLFLGCHVAWRAERRVMTQISSIPGIPADSGIRCSSKNFDQQVPRKSHSPFLVAAPLSRSGPCAQQRHGRAAHTHTHARPSTHPTGGSRRHRIPRHANVPRLAHIFFPARRMHACLVRCGRGGRVSTRWHVGGYRSSMTTQEHTSYARLASALTRGLS